MVSAIGEPAVPTVPTVPTASASVTQYFSGALRPSGRCDPAQDRRGAPLRGGGLGAGGQGSVRQRSGEPWLPGKEGGRVGPRTSEPRNPTPVLTLTLAEA